MNHEKIVSFLLHLLKRELSTILYKEDNIIESLFYGKTKIHYSCDLCRKQIDDYFQSFTVTYCNFEYTQSIPDLFQKTYFEKWYCKYCDLRCSYVTKTFCILPQFLIIQLRQNQFLNNQTNIKMNINIETHETYFLKYALKIKRSYKKVFMDYLFFILNFSDNQSISADDKCKNKYP